MLDEPSPPLKELQNRPRQVKSERNEPKSQNKNAFCPCPSSLRSQKPPRDYEGKICSCPKYPLCEREKGFANAMPYLGYLTQMRPDLRECEFQPQVPASSLRTRMSFLQMRSSTAPSLHEHGLPNPNMKHKMPLAQIFHCQSVTPTAFVKNKTRTIKNLTTSTSLRVVRNSPEPPKTPSNYTKSSKIQSGPTWSFRTHK